MMSAAYDQGEQWCSGFGGPFDLAETAAYEQWRAWKLAGYPARAEDLIVPVADPRRLSADEHRALVARCRKANMAIYRAAESADDDGKDLVRRLGRQLGLRRLDANLCADDDGITPLTVTEQRRRGRYIPYSNRPLSWHTDGYYNEPDRRIRGLLMHCVAAAAEGGENTLMDHEMVYLLMRDENPDYVAALMQPDVMTIPADETEEGVRRPARTGPVFWVDPADGELHMRYTARARNVVWKASPLARAAVEHLGRLLADAGSYRFVHRLAPGEGVVCNNVLHARAGFHDAPHGVPRLLYRARFYDRVTGTSAGTRGRGPCSG